MATRELLLQCLIEAANSASDWFKLAARTKTRAEYFQKGKLGDPGIGAVYVYLDREEQALYVGMSSRPIKRRMHDKTSPHKSARWWPCWEKIQFLPMMDVTDRLTLELLLILALQPKFNSKPGRCEIERMFSLKT